MLNFLTKFTETFKKWRKGLFHKDQKITQTFTKVKNRSFGGLQNLARVIVLPIAILPLAGLLLGIGGALSAYGSREGWSNGALAVFIVMKNAGALVFGLLGLLFAIAISFGYAKNSKGIAALTGFVTFIVSTSVIYGMFLPTVGSDHLTHVGFDPWRLTDNGVITKKVANSGFFANILGLNPTFDLNVFGGILIGAGVAYVHNRTYNLRLPKILAFFGGGRIVPVFGILLGIAYGIIFFFVWPLLLKGFHGIGSGLGKEMGFNYISSNGHLTGNTFHPTATGAFIAFFFGALERLLIPTGLHHVLYTPFWFTEIGGQWSNAAGQEFSGAYSIFFEQYGAAATGHFNQYAGTVFMSGRFSFMQWGYPFAALAMYLLAQKENRPMVGGIMLSAALTSFLTGITEPILFSFLFVAPLLFFFHAFMAGISFMMSYLLNVVVGQGFAAGFIDFTFFGIMPSTMGKETGFYWIFLEGAIMAPAYFFGFYYIIKWRDYATLGRKSSHMMAGGSDVLGIVQESLRSGSKNAKPIGQVLLEGLGMKGNVENTSLNVNLIVIKVKDPNLVSEGMIRLSGSKFIKIDKTDKTVQVRYLTGASQMLSDIQDFLSGKRKLFVVSESLGKHQTSKSNRIKGLFNKKNKMKKTTSKKLVHMDRAGQIYKALGGQENINVLSNCATRLRATVKDITLVNEDLLKMTGSLGIFKSGNNLQIIYGPEVVNIVTDMENFKK